MDFRRETMDNLRYLFGSLRLASQRFWATSVIFVLGVVSSAFIIWLYSEATFHVSSHSPLVIDTGKLSLKISQSHLEAEQCLSGRVHTHAVDLDARFQETRLLADSILRRVEFCEGEENCALYQRYCPEMREVGVLLDEYIEVGREVVRSDDPGYAGSAHEERFDSLYSTLLSRTESLQEVLIDDLLRRKDRLGNLVAAVIALWVILLILVFLVTKTREKHREGLLNALRAAEVKVRLFVTAAEDMIYFQHTDGRITNQNPAMSRLTGRSEKEFEHTAGLWMSLLHQSDHAAVNSLLSQPPHGKSSHELHYRLKAHSGDWRWIHSMRTVIRDEDDSFIGYNCIDRDVTEEKLNAEKLARTTRDLQERIKEQQCLYGVCLIVRDITVSLEEAMLEILRLVQVAFRYPEITRARITINDATYSLEKFRTTPFVLKQDILVSGEKVGAIEVSYLEERPLADQGPFLNEEVQLLDSVAAKIGAHLARRTSEVAVIQNYEFLNSIINSLPYPFYVLNAADYTVRMANAVSGADLSGDQVTCHQLTHGSQSPCSSKSHPCPLKEVKATGKPCVVEHLHQDSHGNTRFHEVHAYPIFDASGEITQVIEYFLDITERKLTETRLGELAAFPANNPNIVMSINVAGEILYMNSATADALRKIGLSPKCADQCLPRDVRHIIARCARSGKGVRNIISVLKERTWTWSFHPVAGQNIIHCYATDITELIKQEREVRLLSAAVNQSSNMVCITDTEGIVEYVNPYFTSVTGYSLAEIQGRPISLLKSGEHDRLFYNGLWETIRSGHSWSGNIRNRRRTGELYWERKTITPVQNDEGDVVSYLSVSNDITAEMATQRKLIEADKMSAIGTLAAGVAHEFKNYLGGIIGNASYAMELLDTADGIKTVSEALPKIIDMGERANDVAMSLLTYSRSRPEDRQPEDLVKLIEKTARLVEKELRIQSIELVTHFEDVPRIEVSASKIQQLLLNLLINAQHAIKSHGVITIALFNRGREIEIRVADTGVGIPNESMEKIFDPFYSTKGVWGKDEVTGTGIGLSICRNIALEHDGELTVESIVGIGTTFTLTLPVHASDSDDYPRGAGARDTFDVMIFSLDKSIIAMYYATACRLNTRLLAADNINYIPDDLAAVAGLVVCDARFAGKLELLRMVERCREGGIPYVMVNCGASEYELADLYHNALASFKELPDFEKIISLVDGRVSPSHAPKPT